jgi:hypothetical protein
MDMNSHVVNIHLCLHVCIANEEITASLVVGRARRDTPDDGQVSQKFCRDGHAQNHSPAHTKVSWTMVTA